MKTTISLIRTILLLTLGISGIYLIFCGVLDNNPHWLRYILLSKILGAAAIWIFCRLYSRWALTDPWIRAYNKWTDQQSEDYQP